MIAPLLATIAADYYQDGESPDRRKVLASAEADTISDAVAAVEGVT